MRLKTSQAQAKVKTEECSATKKEHSKKSSSNPNMVRAWGAAANDF
jgi:hypothetical protein